MPDTFSSQHPQGSQITEAPQRSADWFTIEAIDGSARAGVMRLARGTVQTPVFMPVGTQASVKALDNRDLNELGATIVLANTYHLMLRPGGDYLERAGGVSPFMGWNRPVLTDSGGYQVYSLARIRKLNEQGVVFRSHLDGREHLLTPESAMRLQRQFGSDIAMALDVCAGYASTDTEQLRAADLTHAWLPRNIATFQPQLGDSMQFPSRLFGICQGGFNERRRRESAVIIADSAVDGCAIGGLSVGEPKDEMAHMLAASISALPSKRPRYLMGVGSPEDLWNGVAAGVDMFDCVLPTRVARHGAIFTPTGRVNVRAAAFRELDQPLDDACDCLTCRTTSLAYLHHLFRVGELSAYRLATIHNLRFVTRQMEVMRGAILDGSFEQHRQEFLSCYQVANSRSSGEQRQRRSPLDDGSTA
jgi:queuine tRNA-ribosyltransferase